MLPQLITALVDFAEAITSFGCGDGVPCTITRLQGQSVESCPFEDQREKFAKDFAEDCREGTQAVDECLERVQELFNSGKPPNKAQRTEIISLLNKAQMSYKDSIPFLSKQFNVAMDKTTTEAKAEVEAFAQTRIHSLAQDVIRDNPTALTGQPLEVPQIEVGDDVLDG